MRFVDHLDERLQHCIRVLHLPALATGTLKVLARIDLDAEFANTLQEADPHKRSGVLSWAALLSDFLETNSDVASLEETIESLEGWGLVQVVGQDPRDPVVPGAAPLRLSFAGRVCMGLAPGTRTAFEIQEEPQTWEIFHTASQERAFIAVRESDPAAAHRSIFIAGDERVSHVAGQVAMALCLRGIVAIDAYAAVERGAGLLNSLLKQTEKARGRRILCLPDPGIVRLAAVCSNARLLWIEPEVEARRDKCILDAEVSRLLGSKELNDGRLIGVPDSTLAVPRRVNTKWESLIVPTKIQWELRQVLIHARYRLGDSYKQPGRGKGYRLLLSGLPGTGKSMCAEALATTLNRPIVKLDLSSVLSKWLGETEKLLAQVFDVAEAARAVLVLDEAEALLRQRDGGGGGGGGGLGALSTGVAYLLTRLDSYTGVLVATTNRSRDLDEAFFRRFDDFIVLPIPDAPTRRLLWEGQLGADSGVDLDFVSRQFALSGGLIQGAAIRAKAWAGGLERPLDTPLLLASLARELDKNDRSTLEVLVEPYRSEVTSLLDGLETDD